ncbi:MAG: PAS domain S-box protein [Endomicrobiales bacterium]
MKKKTEQVGHGGSNGMTATIGGEEWLRGVFDSLKTGIIIHDITTGVILDINKYAQELYGYATEEIRGHGVEKLSSNEPSYTWQEALSFIRKAAAGEPQFFEWHARNKAGRLFWVEVNLQRAAIAGQDYLLATVQDITEHRAAGMAVRRSEQRFRTLIESAPLAIAMSRSGLTIYANEKYLHMFGFKSPEELYGRSFLEQVASRSRPLMEEWIRRNIQGFPSPNEMEVTGRRKDGSEFPFYVALTSVELEDGPAYVGFFHDFTERKAAETALNESYSKLERIVDGAINTITAIVETRDPYTAGHQERVAVLAPAIAREMGLSEEKADGVRVAALMHDIGKINVPSEILSRPGKLSEIERTIVQTYPLASYNILKIIEFPWPVATTALQHQERCNGSGYPQHLSEHKISVEARILAVADVVEAMTSIRPYRGARKIDEALDEISRNKGILFDPAVVDACLRLFREKGFSFPEAGKSRAVAKNLLP